MISPWAVEEAEFNHCGNVSIKFQVIVQGYALLLLTYKYWQQHNSQTASVLLPLKGETFKYIES